MTAKERAASAPNLTLLPLAPDPPGGALTAHLVLREPGVRPLSPKCKASTMASKQEEKPAGKKRVPITFSPSDVASKNEKPTKEEGKKAPVESKKVSDGKSSAAGNKRSAADDKEGLKKKPNTNAKSNDKSKGTVNSSKDGNKQKGKKRNESVCKDFLRNMCKRAEKCRFYHPPAEPANKRRRRSWLVFCNDFQNGLCTRIDCRFFHISRDDEETYISSGDIAPSVVDQAMRKAVDLDIALAGSRPVCKEFLRGLCSLGTCRFRHLTRREYEDEVFLALRDEFEIVLGTPEGRPSVRDRISYNDPVPDSTFNSDILPPDDLRVTVLANAGASTEELRRPAPLLEDPLIPMNDFEGAQPWGDNIEFGRPVFSAEEREHMMQEIFNLKNEIVDITRDAEMTVSGLREDLNHLSQENNNLRMEMEQLRAAATEEVMSHKSEVQKLVFVNNDFVQDNRKFQECLQRLENENRSIRRAFENEQRAATVDMQRKIEKFENEIRLTRESLTKSENNLKTTQQEKTQMAKLLDDLRNKIHKLEGDARKKDALIKNQENILKNQANSLRNNQPMDHVSANRNAGIPGLLEQAFNDRGIDLNNFLGSREAENSQRSYSRMDMRRSHSQDSNNRNMDMRSENRGSMGMQGKSRGSLDIRQERSLLGMPDNPRAGGMMADSSRSDGRLQNSRAGGGILPNPGRSGGMISNQDDRRAQALLGTRDGLVAYPTPLKTQNRLRTQEHMSNQRESMTQSLTQALGVSGQQLEDRNYSLSGFMNNPGNNRYGGGGGGGGGQRGMSGGGRRW